MCGLFDILCRYVYIRNKSNTKSQVDKGVMAMWLFTTGGFLSAVEHREDTNMLVVRARDKQSLQTMIDGIELAGSAAGKDLSGLEIVQKTPSDYPWRVEVSKATFALFSVHEIMNHLNYHNFKNAITEVRGEKWHKAAMSVWVDMLAVADGGDGTGTNYSKNGNGTYSKYGSEYGGYSAWSDHELDANLEKSYEEIIGADPDGWYDVDEVAAAADIDSTIPEDIVAEWDREAGYSRGSEGQ